MKRAWHYLLAEPFTWMFYAFFQPRRLERDFATGKFWQRFIIMLRMVIPMVLVAYPIAVLGHIILIPFHLLLHLDIITILLNSAIGIANGIVIGIAFNIVGNIVRGIVGGVAFSIAFNIVGGIVGGIANGVTLSIASGMTSSIAGGIAGGILAAIVCGIAFDITPGFALSIAVGAGIGTVLGITSGILSTFMGHIVGAIALGVIVGMAVGMASGIAVDMAGSIAIGIAGGIAGGIAFGIAVGMAVGIAFIVSYLIGFFHLLFYLASSPSALKAYLKSRGNPPRVFDYLHLCSLYWDETVYLPLPYLKQLLFIAYIQDAERALEEIAFIAAERPRQLRAARGASLEIAIGYLERCKTMRDIVEAAHYFDTIFPQETKLLDPQWVVPITGLREASRDAQRFSGPIGRVSRLEALNDMIKQLKGVHPNVAFRDARLNARLGKVVDAWLALAQQERTSLNQVPIFIGRIDNPYNPGYPLKPEDPLFQGRRDLVQKLESELMKGERRPTFLLASERRMGKSSALLQLPRLLGSRFLPIFYDLQSPSKFANTPTFLGTLAEGIYKEMQTRNLPVERLVYRALRDYSTQLTSPSQLETIIVSHTQSPRYDISPYAAYSLFDSWLSNVESVLEKEDRTLLLMLDEFEKLEEAGQKGTFELSLLLDWFRNIIQYHPRVALLFSGLHTFDDMKEPTGTSWSGYFVNVQTLHVSFLQEDEARRLITKPTPKFSDADIYGDGVVESILDKAGCHPFLVQAVCYALIENLNAKHRECAGIKDVDEAIERIFENFNNYFGDLWNRTDMHQRACLIVLRTLKTANREQLQLQSGLQEQVIGHALNTLLKRDLVRQENGKYSISTPIFSEWVERSRYM